MSAGRFDCMPQRDHRQSVRSAGIFLLQRNAHLASQNRCGTAAKRFGRTRGLPDRTVVGVDREPQKHRDREDFPVVGADSKQHSRHVSHDQRRRSQLTVNRTRAIEEREGLTGHRVR